MKARWKPPPWAEILLDSLLIFFLTAVLIHPLFRAGYFENWRSIESTFISDARFLMEHWPHPQWQPLWYTGTRFDYIYPPALRYGTALLAKAFGCLPVEAYHLYTALFYCLGISGVYLLVSVATRSRVAAWLAAAASALGSPSFLMLKIYRLDSFRHVPQRLHVLVQYGEGPHMTALALIPIALAFTWLAMQSHRPALLALAAIVSAAVVSNNFYGATALALFYSILVWSFWITRRERRILWTALALPLLAYGVTAVWLVPSYVTMTARNLQYVAARGNPLSTAIALAVAAAFAWITARLAGGKPARTWAVFTAGCTLFFLLNVAGNYFFHFLVTGDPLRWVPELDLACVLGAATVLRWLWNRPGRVGRAAAVVVVLAACYSTKGYVRHAWQILPPAADPQSRVEFQIPEWLWQNRPDARTVTSGSVRFWFDAWHDLAQVGGGSEQGLINGLTQNAGWELNLGAQPEPSILWMQCLGVDTVYVAGQRSQDVYKDTQYPRKYAGVLPVIYDDGRGDTIYQVPRRYRARARVVETRRLDALRTPQGNLDLEALRAYANTIERGPDAPPVLTRLSTDAMEVRARIEPGQSLVVQETYDPAWQAWAGNQSLSVRKDAMGFLAVDPPPGENLIRLQFVTPLENRVGALVTLLTLMLLLVLFARSVRGPRRSMG
ncbi:MAG: hypothetical protein LAP40_02460 [Acidobacteriia bacterium]|nr:hypothetical protein [Terriglobia bacterium]